tara:strand:+ start:371 stop:655 length:285 start_codon:yes stop_codon:yes gene_type:complete
MKQKEMIELVQQHHPHMGETEIRKLLNRAMDVLSESTDIIKTSYTDSTIANQRYYELNSNILKISGLTLTDANGDSFYIPRGAGIPEEEDKDLE